MTEATKEDLATLKQEVDTAVEQAKQDMRTELRRAFEEADRVLSEKIDKATADTMSYALHDIRHWRSKVQCALPNINVRARIPSKWPLEKCVAEARKRSLPVEREANIPLDSARPVIRTASRMDSNYCVISGKRDFIFETRYDCSGWSHRLRSRLQEVLPDVRNEKLRQQLAKDIERHDEEEKKRAACRESML